MALNLVKLCVGAASIEDLAAWQKTRATRQSPTGEFCVGHTTFQTPKRQAELLEDGSLYWVIKGVILVRQKLVGFADGVKDDGSAACVLLLDPALVRVKPVPRRAFQGWRYLTNDDAPGDLAAGAKNDVAVMPPKLRQKLADLGLL